MSPFNEVYAAYDHGKLNEQTDDQLRRFHRICVNCQGSDLHSRTKASQVAAAIQTELLRREMAEARSDAGKQHTASQRHGQELQESINRLLSARKIDWAILIVTGIGSLAGIVALVLTLLRGR